MKPKSSDRFALLVVDLQPDFLQPATSIMRSVAAHGSLHTQDFHDEQGSSPTKSMSPSTLRDNVFLQHFGMARAHYVMETALEQLIAAGITKVQILTDI